MVKIKSQLIIGKKIFKREMKNALLHCACKGCELRKVIAVDKNLTIQC